MRNALIGVVTALLVAGCGVKGPPDLPGDRVDAFPRVYPQGAVTPEIGPRGIFERTTQYDSFGRPID